MINNNKLILQAKKENNIYRYESKLELDNLKSINKYFKMFETFEEFRKDFIKLCKSANNMKIIKVNNKEIILNIELPINSDNLLTLILNRVEMSQKELIDFLFKDNVEKTKIINELNLEVQKMNNKISSLEENIIKLNTKFDNLEKIINNKSKDSEKEIKNTNKETNQIKNEKDTKTNEEKQEEKNLEEEKKLKKAKLETERLLNEIESLADQLNELNNEDL